VATIRDGFQGDYYYQLTVADNIPDSLRGKLITLNVTLNPEFFDRLPGLASDPTVFSRTLFLSILFYLLIRISRW
jgi:hypothetical protein